MENPRQIVSGEGARHVEDFEILFVDDEVEILDTVGEYLSQEGYKTTLSDNGLHALGLVKERPFDVVFTDLKMPEFNGLELLAAIKAHRPETEVIIVTGYGTIESAIAAMKFGGYDYMQKPIKLAQLKILCEKIRAEKKLRDGTLSIRKRVKQRNRYEGIVGISPQLQKIYELLERIGQSSPSVLIQGEKGTGKELTARVIHKRSDRADRPFISVNCSALVEGSQETDLDDNVADLFSAAKGGTVFLDEVSQIPASLQPALLQAFKQKDGPYEGGGEKAGTDVRVIAATEKDTEPLIRQGIFPEKLFERIDFFFLTLPPLRERREDICLLSHHFLHIYGRAGGKASPVLAPEVLDIFLEYHWPGNVRQLEYMIKEAIHSGADNVIESSHLPREMRNYSVENREAL